MSSDSKTCVLCGFGTVFLLSVILFAVSFDTLEPHSVAIKYNNNLKVIDEKRVYNNGRYFLGLGLSFIEFPIVCQVIEFRGLTALRMWSLEGQLVTVDLSLMYRLERKDIVSLYKRYALDYHQRLIQICIRTAKKVSIQYTAEEFFQIRRVIGEHMRAEMRRRLATEYVSLELFNLREIAIPNTFEQKVIAKQIEQQKVKTKEFMKETAIRRAATTVLFGITDAQVSLLRANATAERNVRVEKAKSVALQQIAEQEAISYSDLQSALGLSALDLLKYRYAQLMAGLEDPAKARNLKYIIGLQSESGGQAEPVFSLPQPIPTTASPTASPTSSPTSSPTPSPTPSPTSSPTASSTLSASFMASSTASSTLSASFTASSTVSSFTPG